MNPQSREVYEEVNQLDYAKRSSIADLGSLEVIEGLGYFFPRLQVKERSNSVILEVGSGIGTITRMLIRVFTSDIICYEKNEFCVEQLNRFKLSLPAELSSRLYIRTDLSFLRYANGAHVEGEGVMESQLSFFAIFIDGPITKLDLHAAISKSRNLQFIFVQGWRLSQRLQTSMILRRLKCIQQYVEIQHENQVTCALFFVTQTEGMKLRGLRSLISFMSTNLILLPKILKNIAQSRGRSFFVGRILEDGSGQKLSS